MAAPSFIAASTGVTDAGGAWSFDSGALSTSAIGELWIVQLLQDGNTAGAVATTGGSSIEDLAGTDDVWTAVPGPNADGSFPVGSAAAARQFIWMGRSRAAGNSPIIAGTNSTSEDLYCRMYKFTTVSTGTTLATVIENSTAGNATNGTGTDATALDTAVTTLGPDRLALNFVAVNDDNVIPAFTSETGGDWALAVSPYAESSGTDGAIALQIAIPAAILYNASGTGIGFGVTAPNVERAAQSFVATGGMVGVALELYKTGAPTGDVVVEIQSDASGDPSGTVLGSATIPGSSITTSAAWYQVALSASLTASETYWLVLSRSGSLQPSDYWRWTADASGTYANGHANVYYSGAWQADVDAYDLSFGIVTSSNTINGGSATITDSDAWGVVGFALIGTTVVEVTYVPRHSAHDHGSVTIF